MKTKTNIAIVGGGWSGLSAAVELCKKFPVSIFESASTLGGRARRVIYKNNKLDNGQHIFFGSYENTLKTIKLVSKNNEKEIFFNSPLTIEIKPNFKLESFGNNQLSILVSFLLCKGLSLNDKFLLLNLLIKISLKKNYPPDHLGVQDFLNQNKQTHETIKYFWEPLCLAALNTRLHEASAKILVNVIQDLFFGKKKSSDILFAKNDLTWTFPDYSEKYIKENDGKLFLKKYIKKINFHSDKFTFYGINQNFSHVIFTPPLHQFKNITLNGIFLSELFNINERIHFSPIYSIYLQFPSKFSLKKPMIGFSNEIIQWAFDRGIICNQNGLICCVISAEGNHQKMSSDDLIKISLETISKYFNMPDPIWTKIISEKKATFKCMPNLIRPKPIENIKKFYLCGDFLYPRYPSTLEGAVSSGIESAKRLINDL